MKTQKFGFFQATLIFIAVVVLLRFLPVVLRVVQAIAIGVRAFWWAVLPVVICSWVIWKFKRRIQASKSEQAFENSSEHFSGNRPLRDVTDSANDRSIQ